MYGLLPSFTVHCIILQLQQVNMCVGHTQFKSKTKMHRLCFSLLLLACLPSILFAFSPIGAGLSKTAFISTSERSRSPYFNSARLKSSTSSSIPNDNPAPTSFTDYVKVNRPKASILSSSVNLLKNTVGAGVLSINGKVAGVTTDPRQFKNVYLLVFGMAVWAIHNFYLIGETCRLTGRSTFGEAWSESVSKSSKGIVTFVVTLAPIISCIASVIVLHDVLRLFLQVFSFPVTLYTNRAAVIGLLTSFILFPLCIVENLSNLKSISAIGLLGQFFALLAMYIRIQDGSYLPGGIYHSSMVLNKGLASVGSGGVGSWFVLASLLSYCFVAHYNVSLPYLILPTLFDCDCVYCSVTCCDLCLHEWQSCMKRYKAASLYLHCLAQISAALLAFFCNKACIRYATQSLHR